MKPKDTTKKKIKKKNRKLLFQIGLVTMIYSLLAVLVTSGILYCAVVIVYVQTKQDQLSDGLERVYGNIFESEYPVKLTERMLDAIDADPGILTELFPKLYVGIDDEKSDQLMERYYDYIETWEQEYGEIDRGFYKDMPEEYLPCAVVNEYFTLFYDLVSEQNEYQYKNILFLRISQDAQGEYCGRVLFQMDQEDCGESRDYYFDQQHMEFLSHLIEKNRFGESWDDIADHKELADMLKTNSHEVAYEVDYLNEANESMTVYYPIFIEDKPRCVLAITYDWAGAQDILKDNTSGLTRIALLLVMTSEVLLLLFVYFKAVRPLRHVMKSMQKYTEDKNSEEVVQEMDEVRQRNEFGLLADYISDMVQEIDRYTKKNIELAGEKEKAATELELAAKIQNGMLRVDFPNTPEVEIFAMMKPAREVGGDFYDFFEVDATHMALVIADVAGTADHDHVFRVLRPLPDPSRAAFLRLEEGDRGCGHVCVCTHVGKGFVYMGTHSAGASGHSGRGGVCASSVGDAGQLREADRIGVSGEAFTSWRGITFRRNRFRWLTMTATGPTSMTKTSAVFGVLHRTRRPGRTGRTCSAGA